MGNIPVSENPEFNSVMEALKATTPAHADTFNAMYQILLDNDVFLNKEKADKSITKSATLPASGWTGTEAPYTLKLEVEEATETNNIEVNPPPDLTEAQRDAMCNADIDGGGQGEGYIELIAYDEKPVIDLPVILIIRGD